MFNYKSFSVAVVLAGLLVGCGGGGGGNSSSSSTSQVTLIDDFVAGARYVNGTNTGFTDANGQFPYESGDVEFYVGDVKLGTVNTVPVDNKIFLQDLLGISRTNITDTNLIKLGRFLQTLDSDSSTDAIEINQTNYDLFEDPNGTETDLQDASTDVDTLLGNAGFNSQNIVTSGAAQNHIENILESQGEITTSTILSLSTSSINDGDTNIELDDEITLDFTDDIPLQYINDNYFILTKDSDSSIIATTISRKGNRVVITPVNDLEYAESYTLTIKSTIKSYSGTDINLGGNVDSTIGFSTISSSNQAAVWSLANGTTTSAVENTTSSYVIDLTASSDSDGDYLSYEWFLSPTGSPGTIYNQSSGSILANTTSTIDFTTADQRTNTPAALPAGTYDLRIVQYEDRGSGNIVSTSQTVTITITAASSGGSVSSNDFILKIDTEAYGNDGTNDFLVSATTSNVSLNVDCDNDGTDEATGVGSYTCSYTNDGVYDVRVSGSYGGLSFNSGDPKKITEIVNWGNNPWTTMEYMFLNASNLTSIASNAGVPDLSNVTSMASMFRGAGGFNVDISSWDVSNVENMSNLFNSAGAFNQDISSWNTSNVTDMSIMFRNTGFNQDISSWDTSSVTSMYAMFFQNSRFNQNLDSWDVSSVTNMREMFYRASSFNQGISSWQIQNVINMINMFNGASSFNQNLSALYPRKNSSLVTTDIFASSGMSQANQDSFFNAPVLDAVISVSGQSGTPVCSPSQRVGSEFITFTGNSSTGNIVSYSWTDVTAGNSNNFIDGGTTVSETYSCVGLSAGQRTIRLTVEDSSGATDTQDQTINIVY